MAKAAPAIYKEHFESDFLRATELFYQNASPLYLADHPVTEYMKRAEAWLLEETRRIDKYLHRSTKEALVRCCERTLLEAHVQRIWDEFSPLLEGDARADLARTYALLARLPDALGPLQRQLEEHVKRVGLNQVDGVAAVAEKDPRQYVSAMLVVHRKYNELVLTAFRNENRFVAALDKAFRDVVNRNSVCAKSSAKSPELLARYSDLILRKGSVESSVP